MAPSFTGKCLKFECPGCKSDVICDFGQARSRRNLVCPYCGETTPTDSAEVRPSELVSIELGNKRVQRWDVVAFEESGRNDAGIKRVVGLPNEALGFRGGDIFANGKILRKPIEVQKDVRVLVHDTRFIKPSVRIWFSEGAPDLVESATPGVFRFSDSTAGSLNWFRYQGGQNYSRRDQQRKLDVTNELAQKNWPLSAIEDNYGYNQSLNRTLNPTADLFVEFKVTPISSGKVAWRLSGKHELKFVVDFERMQFTFTGGSLLRSTVPLADLIESNKPVLVEFSSFDQQLLVLINGERVFEKPFGPNVQKAIQYSNNVFEIGGDVGDNGNDGDQLLVEELKIWRDIYYLPGHPLVGSSDVALLTSGKNEYLLLGDNVPISRDSREWDPAAIPVSKIIGIVKKK